MNARAWALGCLGAIACAAPHPIQLVDLHRSRVAPSAPAPRPSIASLVRYDDRGREVERTESPATLLEALDAQGRTLWRWDGEAISHCGLTGHGDVVGVAMLGGNGTLFELDASARLLWATPFREAKAGAEGLGFGPRGPVLAFVERNKYQVWSYSTSGEVIGRLELPYDSNGPDYRMGRSGVVFRIDNDAQHAMAFAPDGAIRWQGRLLATPGDPSARFWRPEFRALAAGSVAFMTRDERVVVHDAEGQPLWSIGLRAGLCHWPTPDAGVVIGSNTAELTGLGPDGRVRWRGRFRDDSCTFWQKQVVVLATGETAVLGQGAGQRNTDSPLTVVSLDGKQRWGGRTKLAALPSRLRLEQPSSGATRLVSQDEKIAVALAPLARPEPVRPPEVRVFERQLEEPIHALLLVGEKRLLARSSRRIAEWNGVRWGGFEPLRLELEAVPLLRGVTLAGIDPTEFVRGPGGRPWLLGIRRAYKRVYNEVRAASGVILEARGGAWHELSGPRPEFMADAVADDGYVDVGAAAVGDAAIVCSFGWCRRLSGGRSTPLAMPAGFTDACRVYAVGQEVWIAGSTMLRVVGDRTEPLRDVSSGCPRISATSSRDVWMISGELSHFDGHAWQSVPLPLERLGDVWSRAVDDVWVVGKGLAHFDGKGWRRVAGIDGELSVVQSNARGDVWVGGPGGLWHAGPGQAEPRMLTAPSPETPDAERAPLVDLPQGPACSPRAERVNAPLENGQPVRGVVEAQRGSDGTIWLRDDRRLMAYDGSQWRVLASLPPLGRAACHQCLAPAAGGEGWIIVEHGLLHLGSGKPRLEPARLPDLLAVAARSAASVVALAGGPDDALPHAIRHDDAGWAYLAGVPPATYVALSIGEHDNLWFAGGLAATPNGRRIWPAGEGILVHYQSGHARWHRIPEGSLLAVTATGDGEAWATGVAGLIVHANRDHVVRHSWVDGVRLRAVWAASSDDLWIAGDDTTLLHWDGRVVRPVQGLDLPPRAPIVSLIDAGQGKLWVVSPAGLVQLDRQCG